MAAPFQSSGTNIDIKARQQRLRASRHWCNPSICPWPFQSPTNQPAKAPRFPRSVAGQQRGIAVHLGAVDRIETGHYAGDPGLDRGRIGRGMGRQSIAGDRR